MKTIFLVLACLLTTGILASAVLYKTTTVDDGDLGEVVQIKANAFTWSAKETGTTTHRGEVFEVSIITVSQEDYDAFLDKTKVWYVNSTTTATSLTTTAISE